MNTPYPLSWPASWPRTKPEHRLPAPFHSTSKHSSGTGESYRSWRNKTKKSMADALEALDAELRRLCAQKVVISTNVELRQDGLPYANRRPPDDPGAAVYFALHALTKGATPHVLACDKWNRVEDNLYAIACHIEALRGQERWGVGSTERAFAGYMALPAPGQTTAETWWVVLGVAHNATFDQIRDAYRDKARVAHPDNGGSNDAMARINNAWDQARNVFAGN